MTANQILKKLNALPSERSVGVAFLQLYLTLKIESGKGETTEFPDYINDLIKKYIP